MACKSDSQHAFSRFGEKKANLNGFASNNLNWTCLLTSKRNASLDEVCKVRSSQHVLRK